LRFPQYVDECCNALLAAAESPTDAILVSMVQMQRMFGKVNQTFPPFERENSFKAPGNMLIESLLEECEDVKNNLPINPDENRAW
jgi:hypothetical protein